MERAQCRVARARLHRLALVLVGYVAFRLQRLRVRRRAAGIGLTLLFVTLLVLTLAEATRQRRALERVVQREREQSARMAGELDAAKRVQIATLPRAELLRDDARVDLAAAMVPAREVGGDLYDFFRLDDRHLFFLVGDVAGKGLSASIFMAVSKALCKSTILRTTGADIGELMALTNAEVSRDNPEMLFVTAFAGVLDLDSGDLVYCNAGHENPYVADPADGTVVRIEDGGGPPLCAVDDFAYRGAERRIRAGELLCLVSDGVTEARESVPASSTAASACGSSCSASQRPSSRRRARRRAARRCRCVHRRRRGGRRPHGDGVALERSRARRDGCER